MTTHPSSIKQANQIINSINHLKVSSSLANRLNEQTKQSKISQYYNVNNKSFSSSQNSNKLLESAQKNPKLFPSFSSDQSINPNQGDLFLISRPENFKQSKVEQSLQKAFSLNRNSQRIPFKKKQNFFAELNYPQGQKRSYNFYQPQYAEYYVKEDKNFWAETFEKFYEKKGSLQNIDFPSFHQKEQSKSSQKLSETKKIIQIQQKIKNNSGIYQKYMNKTTIVYSLVVVLLLMVGLKIAFYK